MISPIETRYKGYRFRSRIEARYAVFFDCLKIDWEYEKEGFNLPSGKYLPDFWFPKMKMWGEVKPDYASFDDRASKFVYELAAHSGCPVLMLGGLPETELYIAAEDKGVCAYYLTNQQGIFYRDPSWQEGLYFPDTAFAREKALSARFEHGEKGLVRGY